MSETNSLGATSEPCSPSGELGVSVGANNRLQFEGQCIANFDVGFMRTLRVPVDGKRYPPPPSVGAFPLRRARDYPESVPPEWLRGEVVFAPVTPKEAVWLHFACPRWNPHAVKVEHDGLNALSGEEWTEELLEMESPDYLVCPVKSWLDGYQRDGSGRQFVALAAGAGERGEYTRVRLVVYPPRPGQYQPPDTSAPPNPYGPGTRFAGNHADVPERVARELVDGGRLTESELGQARELAIERRVGLLPALQELNLAEPLELEEMAARANASLLGISYVVPENLDPEIGRLIPSDLGWRYLVAPISIDYEKDLLTLAMFNPEDVIAVDDITLITGFNIEPVQASLASVQRALLYYFGKPEDCQIARRLPALEPVPPYDHNTWDAAHRACLDVYLVDTAGWARITGEAAPPTPVNATLYRNLRYPWLEEYGDD